VDWRTAAHTPLTASRTVATAPPPCAAFKTTIHQPAGLMMAAAGTRDPPDLLSPRSKHPETPAGSVDEVYGTQPSLDVARAMRACANRSLPIRQRPSGWPKRAEDLGTNGGPAPATTANHVQVLKPSWIVYSIIMAARHPPVSDTPSCRCNTPVDWPKFSSIIG